jgi:hypothetical protein
MPHPRVLKGALVQVAEGVGAWTPNVVAFQYNPASLSRSIEPSQGRPTNGESSGPAPATQPREPKETIELSLELDASDDLGDGHPVALAVGVADRIAAIEKMLLPTKGLFADLAAASSALFGQPGPAPERPTVPIVFLTWGPGRLLPVRIAAYSIEEQAFSASLHPIHASVTVSLEVLTPSQFGCAHGPVVDFAKAAYRLHRLQQEGLAVTHFASNATAGLTLLGGD